MLLRAVGALRTRLIRGRVTGVLLRRAVEPIASFGVIRMSGLFDPDWYAAQRRPGARALPGHSLPLAHYVWRGRRAGAAPHPLFEPSWFAPSTWRDDPADPFARFLLRGRVRRAAPHPLFDPELWLVRHPESAAHRFGPFGHFAATADPMTPMPVPGPLDDVLLTHGRARAGLEAALAGWQVDERRRRAVRAVAAGSTPPRGDHAIPRGDHALPPRGDHAIWTDHEFPAQVARPLVSVVMAVRDRESLVGRAIASVQAQTSSDWELIVVDDGSSDGTASRVAGIAENDSRIRLISTEPQGVCAARNTGAAQARGRFMAWLDSDNTWTPRFLAVITRAMIGGGWPAAHAVVEIVDGAGQVHHRAVDPHALAPADPRGEALALLGVSNYVDLNVLVVERRVLERIGGFDESLRRTVDYDLAWRLCLLPDIDAVPRLVPLVGVTYAHDRAAPDRISVREPASWREVVKNRHLIDWPRLGAEASERSDDMVSVLVPVSGPSSADAVWRTVATALATSAAHEVEVLVTDDARPRGESLCLASLALVHARVGVHRTAKAGNQALAANLAFARSHGAVAVVVEPGVVLDAGWLPGLVEPLDDPATDAVQPLLVGPDGTVASAGSGSAGRPLFAGLPPDDARRAGPHLRVAGSDGAALAVRATDLARAEGLDCLDPEPGRSLAQLPARFEARHPGDDRARPVQPAGVRRARQPRGRARRVVVATGVMALLPDLYDVDGSGRGSHDRRGSQNSEDERADAAIWAAAGFAPDGHRVLPRPAGPARHDVPGLPDGIPSLRWSIKISAPLGPVARRWGDLHFARALAAALERLGQQVVVDARPALGRDDRGLDDVTLVLRGLFAAKPPPTSVGLLWVISHPDLVDADEAAAFDAVLAAGPAWARRFADRTGIPVSPLLQATDPAAFHPDPARSGSGEPVLFVGNARGVFRPVLRELLTAGVDVGVYGDGWDRFIEARHIRARLLANAELPEHYRTAGLVLNDHWDDMRAGGFLSNRLFDAAASGARVVSDAVEGVEELFAGLVRTYGSSAELVDLVQNPDTAFPDAQTRAEQGRAIGREHSFDARARTLVQIAVPLAAKRGRSAGPRR